MLSQSVNKKRNWNAQNQKQQNNTEYPGYRNGLAGGGIGLTSLGERKEWLPEIIYLKWEKEG